jgi:hypothetical protein
MAPAPTCCPNLACPASGHTGPGHLDLHACTDQRFMGPECHQPFSARNGTAWDRLRTSAETVSVVVPLRAHGCPRQALVVALGDAARTVACGLARAGVQGQAVHAPLVEPPRDLGQVHADARRVKTPGGLVWRAWAVLVSTRLWRAGAVRPPGTGR